MLKTYSRLPGSCFEQVLSIFRVLGHKLRCVLSNTLLTVISLNGEMLCYDATTWTQSLVLLQRIWWRNLRILSDKHHLTHSPVSSGSSLVNNLGKIIINHLQKEDWYGLCTLLFTDMILVTLQSERLIFPGSRVYLGEVMTIAGIFFVPCRCIHLEAVYYYTSSSLTFLFPC